MADKIIRHKGIKVKMSVDMDEYIDNVVKPYKERIKTLEALLEKRHKYISVIHSAYKDKNNVIFNMYATNRISKALKGNLNDRRIILLSYLNNVSFCTLDSANKYMKSAGITLPFSNKDVRFFKDNGYARVDGPVIYITYKGIDKIKELVDTYHSAMKFYFENKKKIRTNRKMPTIRDEVRERRSVFYKKMMRPFWESGLNVINRDNAARITVVQDWMKNKELEEADVNFYTKLITGWLNKKPKK